MKKIRSLMVSGAKCNRIHMSRIRKFSFFLFVFSSAVRAEPLDLATLVATIKQVHAIGCASLDMHYVHCKKLYPNATWDHIIFEQGQLYDELMEHADEYKEKLQQKLEGKKRKVKGKYGNALQRLTEIVSWKVYQNYVREITE